MNETSVGIKDIILNDQQNAVLKGLKILMESLKILKVAFIGGIPKYLIETIGLVTIVTTAYLFLLKLIFDWLYSNNRCDDFATQKSLPLAQQIFLLGQPQDLTHLKSCRFSILKKVRNLITESN